MIKGVKCLKKKNISISYMIHSSHSRKDLLEVCDVFDIVIKNREDLNKNELSRMLWLKIQTMTEINPDNEYFFVNNLDELKHFLVNHNSNKLLSIKDKEKIVENARRIISYCVGGYNITGNFDDINDLIATAMNISKYGDISSVRRALRLLKDDSKVSPSIEPVISKRVERELYRKEQIKLKSKQSGLRVKRGRIILTFD